MPHPTHRILPAAMRRPRSWARSARASRAAGAALLLVHLCSAAQDSQEWSCPTGDKVAMQLVAPGWIGNDTLGYPYQAPTLKFDRMENSTHGPAAVCKYRVDGGGLMWMWRFGRCESGKGLWKSSGPLSSCEGANAAECSLVCVSISTKAPG